MTPPDLSDPLVHRQWTLEELMLDSGAAAYRRRVDRAKERGEASTAGGANKLLKVNVEPFAAYLEELVASANAGRPGRHASAVPLLDGLELDVVAFLTAAESVNVVTSTPRRRGGVSGRSLQSVAIRIARRIEDEARLTAFAKEHAGLLRHIMMDLNSRTSNRLHRRTVIVYMLNKRGDNWVSWTSSRLLHLGMFLISAFAEMPACGIEIEHLTGKVGRKTKLVKLTDDAFNWIAARDKDGAMFCPRYLPMVVPPKPWEGMKGGGYLNTINLRLITGFRGKRTKLSPETSPTVFQALNAIQATPWRVNLKVLEALRHAWEVGLEIGIPSQELVPEPAKPVDIGTNAEARSLWRREAQLVHLTNTKNRSKRLAVGMTLDIVKKYEDGVSIYFVHQLDFRGRMYALSTFLNPQGADYSRALLEFADGLPIEDGVAAGWLAIHGANTFGHDKVTLEERIDWVEERNERITRTAADPWQDLWWTEADKPWCFLAWCFEWSQMLQAQEKGEVFYSRVPVALDGSCNGLQHYSAMLRDPVGGSATNLVPSEVPTDIYGEVAKVVTNRLSDGIATDGWGSTADKWFNFGIDRKLTKRPVMVLPYGGTSIACAAYVEEAYLKKVEEGTPDPFTKETRRDAVRYLARLVWASIGDVVVAARAAMDWLRAVARVATSAGIVIRWTTPSGFPVRQDYRNLNRRRVKTRLSGAITYISLTEEGDKLDSRKQANGLPPNFVHSLDASALCLTVEVALLNGVKHFAMIHDSYGTHAANTEKLAAYLRHAFVDMYEGSDPLADLERDLRAVLPPEFAAKLPPLPERGTLDLQGVLKSDFFFA